MLDWDASAAKSALRRGGITQPTRRDGLMALLQHPPDRLTTNHVWHDTSPTGEP